MYSEKILSIFRTVAFKLTMWYTAFFTGGVVLALAIFHLALLRGIHHVYLSPYSLHELLEAYRRFFGYSLAVIAIMSILVGWFLARRALSGVVQLTRTAEAVAGGALKERVPVKGKQDEIDRLAMAFNTMVERIDALIHGMKETNDSIAHDLRSPVARIRGSAEAALLNHASSDVRALAGEIIEQCDRLLSFINTVMDISEAEAKVAKLVIEELDAIEIIRDAVGLFLPVAEEKDITVNVQALPEARILSDRRKLQRILGNLLDNAIKFTPQGGSITIFTDQDEEKTVIGVRDTGMGIAEKDLRRIFEKFFRAEESRSKPGSGLGLSLARALASSLGGSLGVTSSPGQGSTFTLTLPRN